MRLTGAGCGARPAPWRRPLAAPLGNSRGFTLVEMLVATALCVGLLIAASYSFQRVLAGAGQQSRSVQSNIEGVVGLELLRYDLEHAGYGLPWGFQNYTGAIRFRHGSAELEVAEDVPVPGLDATALNAVTSRNIQSFGAASCDREVGGGAVSHPAGGPDYLVLRSSIAAQSDAARKWSYLNYSTDTVANLSYLRPWGNSEDLVPGDRFVTVRSSFSSSGTEDKILLQDASDNFEVALTPSGTLPAGAAFKPADQSQVVTAYGVAPQASPALRMPYNRADYYVQRPAGNLPRRCSPGTGILFKSLVSHGSGGFASPYALLDCVGDLQVEFEYDANDDGNISYLSPAALSALSAREIRAHLKNVRVYILTHEGGADRSYSYSKNSIQVGDRTRPASSGRTLSDSDMNALFTGNWRNYRWKVYTIVTRPKNLVQ